MASRTPIITTATGAEGLSLVDGESYLRAETAADFVKQIRRLAHDTNLHTTLTTNAFQLAKEKYSWESITKDLIKTYHQLTAQAN
jgi:glycosyltransferase involved in cell wall biosynthesis